MRLPVSFLYCPGCNAECVAIIGSDMKKDDFSVCSRCGSILQFNKDLTLRLCDYKDDVDLFCNTSLTVFNDITDARNYIKARKEISK
jgi:transcription elongation factor Elf1